jgi:hypothetical protein
MRGKKRTRKRRVRSKVVNDEQITRVEMVIDEWIVEERFWW